MCVIGTGNEWKGGAKKKKKKTAHLFPFLKSSEVKRKGIPKKTPHSSKAAASSALTKTKNRIQVKMKTRKGHARCFFRKTRGK